MKILRTLYADEAIPEGIDPSCVRIEMDGVAHIVEHDKPDLTEYYASMAAPAPAASPEKPPSEELIFGITG